MRIRRYYEEIIDHSPQLTSKDLHLGEKSESPVAREIWLKNITKVLEEKSKWYKKK